MQSDSASTTAPILELDIQRHHAKAGMAEDSQELADRPLFLAIAAAASVEFFGEGNHTFKFQMHPVNRDRCRFRCPDDENRFISSFGSQFSLQFTHLQLFFSFTLTDSFLCPFSFMATVLSGTFHLLRCQQEHLTYVLHSFFFGFSFDMSYGRSRWGPKSRGNVRTSTGPRE